MKGTKEAAGSPKGATKSRSQAGVRATAKSRVKAPGATAGRAEAGHSGMSVGSRKTASTTKGASHK